MKHSRLLRTLSALVAILAIPGLAFSDAGRCVFQTSTMTFSGDFQQQARCLLSPVRKLANVGDPLQKLPQTLSDLVGEPVAITPETLRAHLDASGLTQDDVGGDLTAAIARTSDGRPAQYFVIHDTSSPFFGNRPFPDDLNKEPIINNLDGYRHPTDAKAHVFVNRAGEVYLGHDFSIPWRATKLELRFAGTSARGRFLHIELVQPRRSDPALGSGNDAIAPQPGFTDEQYRRLAELYVAASLRAGVWLIPAYHAVLDSGFVGGHDDPQNFDLEAWDAALGAIIRELKI